jgi:predicted nucleic acid-binding protein
VKSPRRVVSDTSPLISLEKIEGGYTFLGRLYNVLIPPEVLQELAAGAFESGEAYLSHFAIGDLLQVEAPERSKRDATEHLDPGEQEAIELAVEFGLPLLIEEEAGRTVAREIGLDISGIAGQLLQAVREEIIGPNRASQMITELKRKGRINQQVFEGVRTWYVDFPS